MSNEEAFKRYLVNIGMNPEWLELVAVMEIIRNTFIRELKNRERSFRIRENQIIMGKDETKGNFKANTINLNEFELGNNEAIVFSPKTKRIEYIKSTAITNFEKREIDCESGVVVRHLKKYGGNAAKGDNKDCYLLVEYIRDANSPNIIYKTIYRNSKIENNPVQKSIATEYDFAHPVEIEKNETTHRKTPIYFIKRYPKYEKWFNERFKSKDEYIKRVFSMQKNILNKIWKEQRSKLEEKIIIYAKTQDKLDLYYSGLQEIFNTNVIGPVFKVFIKSKIESIIVNDELNIFIEHGESEEMLNEIMTRLEQDISAMKLEEIVKRESVEVIERIGEYEEYQNAKETFYEENEDEDYSLESALEIIDDKSSIVEGFLDVGNPFNQEIEMLDEKIFFLTKQIKILKKAYKAFPKRRKNLKEAIEEIENKQIKKRDVFPSTNPSQGEDGR